MVSQTGSPMCCFFQGTSPLQTSKGGKVGLFVSGSCEQAGLAAKRQLSLGDRHGGQPRAGQVQHQHGAGEWNPR